MYSSSFTVCDWALNGLSRGKSKGGVGHFSLSFSTVVFIAVEAMVYQA